MSLLKTEWIKLKYYKSFWALLAFFVIAIACANYFAYKIYYKQIQAVAGPSTHGIFSLPEVWQTVSYISGFLFLIPALLIIMLVTNEITFGTHRQNIINGVSRVQYVNVKFGLIAIISLYCSVVVFITVIIFGLRGNAGAINFSNAWYVLYFYLQCMLYCTVAFIFAIFIKKAGMAIGTFVLYAWVFEKSVSGILNSAFKNNIGNYLPLSASDKLIPIPFGHKPGVVLNNDKSIILLVTAIIYLLVMYFLVIQKSKKEDISR